MWDVRLSLIEMILCPRVCLVKDFTDTSILRLPLSVLPSLSVSDMFWQRSSTATFQVVFMYWALCCFMTSNYRFISESSMQYEPILTITELWFNSLYSVLLAAFTWLYFQEIWLLSCTESLHWTTICFVRFYWLSVKPREMKKKTDSASFYL